MVWLRNGTTFINTLVEMAPHDPEVEAVMAEHIGLMRESLMAQVRAAQEAGEIDRDRPAEVVTLLIMTFMAGLAATLKGPLGSEQAHGLLDAQIDAVT